MKKFEELLVRVLKAKSACVVDAAYQGSLHNAIAELRTYVKGLEERGARAVLDAIADSGHCGIFGDYGDHKKRDEFVRRVLNPEVPR